MTGTISFHNRQRRRRIDTHSLEESFVEFLSQWPSRHETYHVAVHFISQKESARLNQTWLRHEGPTDVITFDYNEPKGARQSSAGRAKASARHRTSLSGEIFICVEEAVRQAREFKTSRQEELIRYVIHGLLHLSGFDDLEPGPRREMKRHENRLIRKWNRRVT